MSKQLTIDADAYARLVDSHGRLVEAVRRARGLNNEALKFFNGAWSNAVPNVTAETDYAARIVRGAILGVGDVLQGGLAAADKIGGKL